MQVVLEQHIKSGKLAVAVLPADEYLTGRYFERAEDEERSPVAASLVIINNNKHVEKVQRAKDFGLWFVRPDGSCAAELVDQVLTHGGPLVRRTGMTTKPLTDLERETLPLMH